MSAAPERLTPTEAAAINKAFDPPEPELLTVEEVAGVLRISVRSAYRAIAADAFPVPVFRPTPRRVLVSRVMLDRYLATGVPVRAVAS